VTTAEVAELVRDLSAGAHAALAAHPTAYDVRCVVDAYADDTIDRCLLPFVAAQRAS
jgi:hypothetical protein